MRLQRQCRSDIGIRADCLISEMLEMVSPMLFLGPRDDIIIICGLYVGNVEAGEGPPEDRDCLLVLAKQATNLGAFAVRSRDEAGSVDIDASERRGGVSDEWSPRIASAVAERVMIGRMSFSWMRLS